MSEPFVFDPRCDLCKEPFGAVPCGTAVTFHCRPLATEGFSHCALVLSCEFSGTQREQELPLEGFAGERLCFSGTLTAPELPDLLWYHFRFWRDPQPGLLWWHSGGDHVETGRFEGPWCHHAVPLPHFRVRLQPPL